MNSRLGNIREDRHVNKHSRNAGKIEIATNGIFARSLRVFKNSHVHKTIDLDLGFKSYMHENQ